MSKYARDNYLKKDGLGEFEIVLENGARVVWTRPRSYGGEWTVVGYSTDGRLDYAYGKLSELTEMVESKLEELKDE